MLIPGNVLIPKSGQYRRFISQYDLTREKQPERSAKASASPTGMDIGAHPCILPKSSDADSGYSSSNVAVAWTLLPSITISWGTSSTPIRCSLTSSSEGTASSG